jgi:hypothetical protein
MVELPLTFRVGVEVDLKAAVDAEVRVYGDNLSW